MSGFQSKRLMREDRLGHGLTIDGLTMEQVKLLDRMWQFQDIEDLEAWAASLEPDLQLEVQSLVKMVMLAHFDQVLSNIEASIDDPYAEANAYLKKFHYNERCIHSSAVSRRIGRHFVLCWAEEHLQQRSGAW